LSATAKAGLSGLTRRELQYVGLDDAQQSRQPLITMVGNKARVRARALIILVGQFVRLCLPSHIQNNREGIKLTTNYDLKINIDLFLWLIV
jgi:hypothetical protein